MQKKIKNRCFLPTGNADTKEDKIWFLDINCSNYTIGKKDIIAELEKNINNQVILGLKDNINNQVILGDGKTEKFKKKYVIVVR